MDSTAADLVFLTGVVLSLGLTVPWFASWVVSEMTNGGFSAFGQRQARWGAVLMVCLLTAAVVKAVVSLTRS
jgi:hypothetical protein